MENDDSGEVGEGQMKASGGELEKAALTLETLSAGGVLQLKWPRQKVKTSVAEVQAGVT